MDLVIYTALGVGLATVIGALIGFIFKNISHRLQDGILGFASGVMLAAAFLSLIFPSIDLGGKYGLVITIIGIFAGAIFLNVIDKIVPHLHKLADGALIDNDENQHDKQRLNKIILFVIAIAIHNFPEGIAAGVGAGSGNVADTITIALSIAIQNIPEGMIIISPMIMAGISKKRTFFIACLTGVIEVVGTFIGYFAIAVSSAILPFALAFAGGTMLYVINNEMIPETHSHGNEVFATYALLVGFSLILVLNTLI